MRIGYFTPTWPLGSGANGISTTLGHLTRQLRQEGHSTHFICPQRSPLSRGPIGDEGGALSVRFLEDGRKTTLMTKLRYRLNPQQTFIYEMGQRIAEAADAMVRQHDIEIFEMEESMGWAKAVVERLSIPVVVRLHGPWFLLCNRGLNNTLSRENTYRIEQEGRAIAAASAITSPSLDVMRKTIEKYRNVNSRCQVIPNSVPLTPDEESWSPPESQRPMILFVGRFDYLKGGDTVVKAFNKVADQNSDAELHFVGPDRGLRNAGDTNEWLDQFASKNLSARNKERFIYLGERNSAEITKLRRKASVTVVASRYENFPTVVLEAMSAGCPIIATSVGGIPEILRDGQNSILFEHGNSDQLADAILGLLSEPDLARELGRQARTDFSLHYTPARVARQHLEFYDAVTNCQTQTHYTMGNQV